MYIIIPTILNKVKRQKSIIVEIDAKKREHIFLHAEKYTLKTVIYALSQERRNRSDFSNQSMQLQHLLFYFFQVFPIYVTCHKKIFNFFVKSG